MAGSAAISKADIRIECLYCICLFKTEQTDEGVKKKGSFMMGTKQMMVDSLYINNSEF